MKRLWFLVFIAYALGFGGVAQAAECAAPPAPDIDWKRCSLAGRVLVEVDLTDANLDSARFHRADLSGAVLAGVSARRTKFNSAIMVGVDLSGALLHEADFTRADLIGADFSGADLSRAVLYSADLTGANLEGAILTDTDFQKADLSGAVWVDGTHQCAEGSIGYCIQKIIAAEEPGGGL